MTKWSWLHWVSFSATTLKRSAEPRRSCSPSSDWKSWETRSSPSFVASKLIILLPVNPLRPPPLEEFTRAVYVATGIKLTHHLVNTVFKIFDEDRDNKLSHKEFIGVMKERLHRGDRVSAGPSGDARGATWGLQCLNRERMWLCVSKYTTWESTSVIGPWSSNLSCHK